MTAERLRFILESYEEMKSNVIISKLYNTTALNGHVFSIYLDCDDDDEEIYFKVKYLNICDQNVKCNFLSTKIKLNSDLDDTRNCIITLFNCISTNKYKVAVITKIYEIDNNFGFFGDHDEKICLRFNDDYIFYFTIDFDQFLFNDREMGNQILSISRSSLAKLNITREDDEDIDSFDGSTIRTSVMGYINENEYEDLSNSNIGFIAGTESYFDLPVNNLQVYINYLKQKYGEYENTDTNRIIILP